MKHTWYGTIGIALALGICYVATLLPGTGYHTDTAKFQFIGRILGTPHATGYPTYILLNHVFTGLFPVGSLAWRANLLSALCAVATCLLIYRILLLLRIRQVIAAATALTFGLTHTFWSQAVVAEVYTLNALFVAAVICLLLEWQRRRRDRWLLAAAFVYAVSLGNHLTMIALAPGILGFILVVDRRAVTRPQLVLGILACLALGIAQYGYIFWRTRHPGETFLEMTAPDWRTFWNQFTGRGFRQFMFAYSAKEILVERMPQLMRRLISEWGLLSLAIPFGLAVAGTRRILALLVPALAGLLFIVINYSIPDITVYLIPAVIYLGILVGAGLQWLANHLPAFKRAWLQGSWLLLPLAMGACGWNAADQSANTGDARRTEAILDRVRRDAVILAPDNRNAFYLRYYLLGENRQRDNLHVLQHFDARPVAGYLRGESTLILPGLRRTLQPGLDVYAINPDHVSDLREAGFTALPVESDLFLMGSAVDLERYRARREVAEPALPLPSEPLHPVGDGIVRFESGWGPVEEWGRWATGSEATLTIPADRLPGRLALTVAPWGKPGHVITCRAVLEGQEIDSVDISGHAWQWQAVILDLPACGQGGDVYLSLRFVHANLEGQADPRQLALPLRSAKLISP